MKARATDCLSNSLSDLKAKTVPSHPEAVRAQFDQWHERACADIMGCFDPFPFSYGQAQKWLNMTIKYRWFFNESDPLNGWVVAAHVPVDEFVLRAAKEHHIPSATTSAWSRWGAPEYKTFQESIRVYAGKCGVIPLELEQRWWMKQSAP